MSTGNVLDKGPPGPGTKGFRPGSARSGPQDGRPRRAPGLGIRVKELEDDIRRTRWAAVCGLSQLLDLRDLHAGVHSTRLAEWGTRVAMEFGLDEEYQRNVEVASMLHDIGKIGIPDSVLLKRGPLSPEERSAVNLHPEYGWGVLRLIPGLEPASLFVLHHHERVDGQGFPGGLVGKQIPFGARIVTVVDAFDAMISDRSYRQRLSLEEAVSRLEKDAGAQFDAEVVETFVGVAREDLDPNSELNEPLPA